MSRHGGRGIVRQFVVGTAYAATRTLKQQCGTYTTASKSLHHALAMLAIFCAACTSLSTLVFQRLYLHMLSEGVTFGVMLTDVIARLTWPSLATVSLFGASLFVSVWMSLLGKRADAPTAMMTRAIVACSVISWPLLVWPLTARDDDEGVARSSRLGNVLVADVVLMFVSLCVHVASTRLPPHMLFVGPCGALALTPSRGPAHNPERVTAAFSMLLLLLPSIYANLDYTVAEMVEVANPVELYACIHVFGGAVAMIVRFMPRIRWTTCAEFATSAISAMIFTATYNHNMAAAWALL